jgi:hypothetical protein
MSKEYILIKDPEYRAVSIVSGCPAYKLTFMDIDTLERYICWVDTANDNYHNNGWAELLGMNNMKGIYTGLKRAGTSARGQKKINADSIPHLIKTLKDSDIKEIKRITVASKLPKQQDKLIATGLFEEVK